MQCGGWPTVILLAAAVACGGRSGTAPEVLTILAPASPGGGWDQTARAMQAALQEDAERPAASAW